MELGAFSISLDVKNLKASRQFYGKIGFEVFGGDPSQNWLILKNGDHTIGLFQRMDKKLWKVESKNKKNLHVTDN